MSHRISFLILFLSLASGLIVSGDTVIENFEPPTQSWRVSSYPGEDVQPSNWRFDSSQGAAGTSNSFYLYGNTWKRYDISDKSAFITRNSVWEVYARVPSISTIVAFGLTDGLNEVFYTFEAYTPPSSSGGWVASYTGWKETSGSFQRFKLPVGRDFFDRYDPAGPVHITTLLFVNDRDSASGTVYFDQISDITESEPEPPVVDAGADIQADINQPVYFSCQVIDPDSSVFSYLWDFADGSSHTGVDPLHAFAQPGTYNVMVTVRDPTGLIGRDSLLVTVGGGAAEPVVSMLFAGDVMFARRFEDPDDSPQWITSGDQGSGARYVAGFTRKFGTDLTAINLESPLTNQGYTHPMKEFCFRSRPDAVAGITESGAGMICLANNHMIDYMEPGIEQTLDVLADPTTYSPYARDVDLPFTGGGMTLEEASLPAFFVKDGLRIGFVALCSVNGLSGNEQPYFDAGYDKPGMLFLDEPNLKNVMARSESVADLTVVMIHGGVEYSDVPSTYVQDHARMAVDLGADLVICHHPHVSQGIEIYNNVPIAYSLGNYIFDQKYQHTMMSFMVDTRLDYQGVHQMSIIPIYLEDFIPKFLVGDSATRTIHRVMHRSEALGTTIIPDLNSYRGIVDLGNGFYDTDETSQSVNMPTTYNSAVSSYISSAWQVPADRQLASVNGISGTSGNRYLLLGHDMLMFGNFEEEDLDDDTLESPGWTIPGTDSAKIHDYSPYEGDLCLRLRRSNSHTSSISVATYRRIPVQYGKIYMVCGYVRTFDSGSAWGTVTFQFWPYTWDDWRDTEITVLQPMSGDNEWQYFQAYFTPPADLNWATIKFYLNPWSGSETYGYAYFDNIRFVEFDETTNPSLPMDFPNPGGDRYVALRTSALSPGASVNLSTSGYEAADTDEDGVPDFIEDANADGVVQPGETSPLLTDSDFDGLDDGEEFRFGNDGYITLGFRADTDGDGYSDGQEAAAGTHPVDDLSHPAGPTATPTPSTPTPTPPPPTSTPTPTTGPCDHTGDVNMNGEITAADAQLAFYIALGIMTPSFDEACAADCNGSGDATAADAQQIFMAALGSGNCVDPL